MQHHAERASENPRRAGCPCRGACWNEISYAEVEKCSVLRRKCSMFTDGAHGDLRLCAADGWCPTPLYLSIRDFIPTWPTGNARSFVPDKLLVSNLGPTLISQAVTRTLPPMRPTRQHTDPAAPTVRWECQDRELPPTGDFDDPRLQGSLPMCHPKGVNDPLSYNTARVRIE